MSKKVATHFAFMTPTEKVAEPQEAKKKAQGRGGIGLTETLLASQLFAMRTNSSN